MQKHKRKASDIHIEPFENQLLLRFRIDGTLIEALKIQPALAPLVISRIKVMAKLDIAEKRLPQDGRISLRIIGHTVDVCVSTIPASHGERIVLRILDKTVARLNLSLLGMDEDTLQKIKDILVQPHGIILVTGSNLGSKTTSLYAMLNELNQSTRTIF